jgi:hypothetical protein
VAGKEGDVLAGRLRSSLEAVSLLALPWNAGFMMEPTDVMELMVGMLGMAGREAIEEEECEEEAASPRAFPPLSSCESHQQNPARPPTPPAQVVMVCFSCTREGSSVVGRRPYSQPRGCTP